MSASAATPILHRLRFVFEHSVPVLRFVPDMTQGDIARIWGEVADRHSEPVVAIDVTIAPEPEDRAAMAWLPGHLPWGPGPQEG